MMLWEIPMLAGTEQLFNAGRCPGMKELTSTTGCCVNLSTDQFGQFMGVIDVVMVFDRHSMLFSCSNTAGDFNQGFIHRDCLQVVRVRHKYSVELRRKLLISAID
jgi:hypothetical protein